MEYVDLNNATGIETSGHASKGNQLKWKREDIWYKADHMGYEGLAETMVSFLLSFSNVKHYVSYEPVRIRFYEHTFTGCKSRNFLGENEELITFETLFRQYTGRSLALQLGSIPSVKERILYLVEKMKEITGLENFGQYLTAAIEIDTFFLNEDRHTNNLAVIYEETIGYRFCPFFDHGLSLYSDTQIDFPMELSSEECRRKIQAKPFSRDFDEQLDAMEELYGKQIRFHFGDEEIRKCLMKLEAFYGKIELQRAEETLRQQQRKYQYLFEH